MHPFLLPGAVDGGDVSVIRNAGLRLVGADGGDFKLAAGEPCHVVVMGDSSGSAGRPRRLHSGNAPVDHAGLVA